MSNTDRHTECYMRTALGNCDPIGGFCTSVNESICEALHKVSRPQGEWIYVTVEEWMKTGRDYGHHCSECDEVNETGKSNYCPQCGTRMKGVGDEMR